MIKIIDTDFISRGVQNRLEEHFMNSALYNFNDLTVTPEHFEKISKQKRYNKIKHLVRDGSFFSAVHLFKNNTSADFELVRGLALHLAAKEEFKIKDVFRIKTNLSCQIPYFTKDNFNSPHQDREDLEDCYSVIYYVNESDGNTRFFDNEFNIIKEVKAKKGRVIIFNSSIYHAGSHPIKSKYRICTNFVFPKLEFKWSNYFEEPDTLFKSQT